MDRTALGPYELLEPIGKGGMGAVYKARDTRLGRLVAIKVIADDAVGDPDRRRRLLAEARAASLLQHPNIVTIHEIGEADGVDYIVMEYVDGESLAQRAAPGREGSRRMPLDDALRIASQVAGALAAAHASGIVHRDLKPPNVMLTRDGNVKLLDFGLAKATRVSAAATGALTMTAGPATAEGTILGTVGYMSPEQAEGKPVDPRSDIFSFGILLWEMLTGRRAFQRDSSANTLAAVLRDELPPPSSISTEVTPALGQAVLLCLRKDPARRIQHRSDVKVMLDEAIAQRNSSSVRTAAPAPPAAAPSHRLRNALLALGVIVVLAALGVVFVPGIRSALRAITPGGMSTSAVPVAATPRDVAISRFTFDSGVTLSPALTRDGKVAAYASDRAGRGDLDLYVQQVAGRQAIRITEDEANDTDPAFSPDGSKIAFRSERDGGGIFVVDAFGGEPRRIATRGWLPHYSPDGTTISILDVSPYPYAEGSPMYLVPAAGGDARPLAPGFVASEPPFSVGAVWSPDGTRLIFRGRKKGGGKVDWWIVPAQGGAPAPLDAIKALGFGPGPAFPFAWTEDGVYYLHGTTMEGVHLFRVRLAADGVSFEGPPEELVSSNQMAYAGAVSDDGQLLFPIIDWQPTFSIAPLEADEGRVTGELEELPGDRLTKGGPSLSRDGRRMAYGAILSTREQRVEFRVRDIASGRELAVAPAVRTLFSTEPRFSPDGETLVYRDMVGSGRWGSFLVDVEGGAPRELCEMCAVLDFFPDGEALCTWKLPNDVTRRPLDGGEEQPLFLLTEEGKNAGWDVGDATVSPDARFLALLLLRGDGGVEIRIVPIDGMPKTERDGFVVATDTRFLSHPRWSPGGALLYYLSQRSGVTAVWAHRLDPRTRRPLDEPSLVLRLEGTMHPRGWLGIDVARGRLLVTTSRRESNLWTGRLK